MTMADKENQIFGSENTAAANKDDDLEGSESQGFETPDESGDENDNNDNNDYVDVPPSQEAGQPDGAASGAFSMLLRRRTGKSYSLNNLKMTRSKGPQKGRMKKQAISSFKINPDVGPRGASRTPKRKGEEAFEYPTPKKIALGKSEDSLRLRTLETKFNKFQEKSQENVNTILKNIAEIKKIQQPQMDMDTLLEKINAHADKRLDTVQANQARVNDELRSDIAKLGQNLKEEAAGAVKTELRAQLKHEMPKIKDEIFEELINVYGLTPGKVMPTPIRGDLRQPQRPVVHIQPKRAPRVSAAEGPVQSTLRTRRSDAMNKEDRIPTIVTLEDGKVALARYEVNRALRDDLGSRCLKVEGIENRGRGGRAALEYKKAVTDRFKLLWPGFDIQFIQEAKRMGNGPGGGRMYQDPERRGERNPLLVTFRDAATRTKIFDLVMANPRENRDIRRYQDQRHNLRNAFVLRKKKDLIAEEPELYHEIEYEGRLATRIISVPRLDPVTAEPRLDIVEKHIEILTRLGVKPATSNESDMEDLTQGNNEQAAAAPSAAGIQAPELDNQAPEVANQVPELSSQTPELASGAASSSVIEAPQVAAPPTKAPSVRDLVNIVEKTKANYQQAKAAKKVNDPNGGGGGGLFSQSPPRAPAPPLTLTNPTPPKSGEQADPKLPLGPGA